MPLAVGLAVLYALVLLALLPSRYGVNDDLAIIADIRAGCHTSFLSPLLGNALSFLYLRVSGEVPWYGLLILTTLVGCLALLLYALLSLQAGGWLKAALVAALLAWYSRLLLVTGYNDASIISGCSGLVLLALWLARSRPVRSGWFLLPGALLALGFLFRDNGLKGVLVFTAPPVVWVLWTHGRHRWRPVLVSAAPLLLVLGAHVLYLRIAPGPDERRFREFNEVRGAFLGFPIAKRNLDNRKLLAANGWTPNDYQLLLHNVFLDERQFNVQTLRNVRRYDLPETRRRIRSLTLPMRSSAVRVSLRYGPLLLLCLLVWLITTREQGWEIRLFALGYGAYVLLGAAAMRAYFRFPDRIAWPLLISAFVWIALWALLWGARSGNEGKPGLFQHGVVRWGAAFGVAVFAWVGGGRELTREVRETRTRARIYERGSALLARSGAPFVLIQSAKGLRRIYSPLHPVRPRTRRIPLGWTIFSPRFYQVLRQVGVQHGRELLPHLAGTPGALVVGERSFVDIILRYLRQRHGMRCRAVPVLAVAPGARAYRLRCDGSAVHRPR